MNYGELVNNFVNGAHIVLALLLKLAVPPHELDRVPALRDVEVLLHNGSFDLGAEGL